VCVLCLRERTKKIFDFQPRQALLCEKSSRYLQVDTAFAQKQRVVLRDEIKQLDLDGAVNEGVAVGNFKHQRCIPDWAVVWHADLGL
jgi:hypothetical protein